MKKKSTAQTTASPAMRMVVKPRWDMKVIDAHLAETLVAVKPKIVEFMLGSSLVCTFYVGERPPRLGFKWSRKDGGPLSEPDTKRIRNLTRYVLSKTKHMFIFEPQTQTGSGEEFGIELRIADYSSFIIGDTQMDRIRRGDDKDPYFYNVTR